MPVAEAFILNLLLKNGNVILGRRAFPKFLSTPFVFCHAEVRKLSSSPREESEHF